MHGACHRTLATIRQYALQLRHGERIMTILTIASSKGGPGKTTMAELIVGTLASQGINVIALDADPTGGLSRWAARL
jgi:Mrp family chromosome partitioning ATPase